MQNDGKELTEKNVDEVLDYKAAAAYIKRAEITLRHMVMRGEIPYYKMGSSVRFDLKDLKEWKAKHRVEVKTKTLKENIEMLPFDEGHYDGH